MKILHIYGQQFEHEDVIIVGDRESLDKLRAQLSLTGNFAVTSREDYFTNDGEGFTVQVHCTDDIDVNDLAVPYTDEASRERRPYVFWPFKLKEGK